MVHSGVLCLPTSQQNAEEQACQRTKAPCLDIDVGDRHNKSAHTARPRSCDEGSTPQNSSSRITSYEIDADNTRGENVLHVAQGVHVTYPMAQKVKQVAKYPDLARTGLILNTNMVINSSYVRNIT